MWGIQDEKNFFDHALKGSFANEKDLFYEIDGKFLAYIPKIIKKDIPTLQSRNTLIGKNTETWCQKLLEPLARKLNLFAINGVICDELGLNKSSKADLAFCTRNEIYQRAEDIKLVFEIKMSIVNNYEFTNDELQFVGDYKTHKALPSLTRSDSMLKAIGKATNIRLSCESARNIPIIVLGNTHISKHYLNKVDKLGQYGILQKIISLNPNLDSNKHSKLGYFDTPMNKDRLYEIIEEILRQDFYYFSAMMSKKKLGQIIKKYSHLDDETQIAQSFLNELERL